jgi:nucleoside-diphosphate-sugar epimerase
MLIDSGFLVTALIKSKREKEKLNSKVKDIIISDLARKGSWQNQLKDFDYIIHLASQISSKNPHDFIKNNVMATKNLVIALKKGKVQRIIHFSSASVTSIRQDMYSKTKNEQEKIIINSKIDYIIIRPSMIYGPGDKKNIGWLIKIIKILPVIPLPGGGTFGRQPVNVKDICRVVIKLLNTKNHKRIYEIHGTEYITMKEMVETIVKVFKMKKLIIPIPVDFLKFSIKVSEKILPNPKFTSDQIDSLISGEKFSGENWTKTFGIIPTKFKDGVIEMRGE